MDGIFDPDIDDYDHYGICVGEISEMVSAGNRIDRHIIDKLIKVMFSDEIPDPPQSYAFDSVSIIIENQKESVVSALIHCDTEDKTGMSENIIYVAVKDGMSINELYHLINTDCTAKTINCIPKYFKNRKILQKFGIHGTLKQIYSLI